MMSNECALFGTMRKMTKNHVLGQKSTVSHTVNIRPTESVTPGLKIYVWAFILHHYMMSDACALFGTRRKMTKNHVLGQKSTVSHTVNIRPTESVTPGLKIYVWAFILHHYMMSDACALFGTRRKMTKNHVLGQKSTVSHTVNIRPTESVTPGLKIYLCAFIPLHYMMSDACALFGTRRKMTKNHVLGQKSTVS